MSRSSRRPFPPGVGAKFKCSVKICGKEFHHRSSLISHLKQHLATSKTIPCLVDGCLKNFSSINSLTGHVSRKHRQVNEQPIRSVSMCNLFAENSLEDVVAPEEEIPSLEERREESLVALAQFHQKLEYKHMVPASVNQLVAKEIQSLLISMERSFLNSLSSTLVQEKLPSDQILSILSSVSQNSEILEVCHSLRSDYMRKVFYERYFNFVTPEKIPLENGSFFYYVPLSKTIQAAFGSKAWAFHIRVPPRNDDDDVLKDFFDGDFYKNNIFFQENPTAIPIVLYQDGFELVCPIGPASNLKHKVIGVYMAFGNLPSHIRFKKDFIQLVALCKNCDFDPLEVYGKIVDDLSKLQEGIQVENVGTVKAGLAFIAGDNLGSHGLAGLVESFSKVKYFCRFCLIHRDKFHCEGGELRVFRRRTVQSYNEDVARVRIVGGKVINSRGVKYNSPFNRLQGFHVCSPALPSCLGHDLGSGIIAHDLKLFIKYFVSEGWFDLPTLNELINKFPYSEEDKKDRPCIIKRIDKPRLAGGAWQLITFLRLFPLIVYGHIKDPHDAVWKLMLLLREITLFSIAPKVHKSNLLSFKYMVEEYLMVRKELFPHVPLRPKHHYLNHFYENFLLFGVLIKVWTLRFESKHCFFSRSWKSSNNNINILQTLSFKHEYFQSWVRSGGSLSCTIESAVRFPYDHTLYSEAIRNAVEQYAQSFLQFEETNYVTVKGTCYKKGHVLILKKLPSCSDLLVGIIHILLLGLHDEVVFVVKQCKASLVHSYGSYKINFANSFECVRQTNLASYYPLQSYVRDTETFICLRHAIVNSPCDPL